VPAALPAAKRFQPFDRRADLSTLYDEGMASDRSAVVVQAMRAMKECDGFLGFYNAHHGVIAAGGNVSASTPAATQPRRDAILEVVRRCGSYTRMSPTDRRQAIAALSERARQLGSPELKVREAVTTSDITSMLQDISGSNFDVLLTPLSFVAARWAAEEGVTTHRAQDIGGMSTFLALCDLTETCRVDSLRTLMGCVMGGNCERDLDAGWEVDFTPADQALIEVHRKRLVHAIRQQDWRSLWP
jgi:hypothetical protein